MHLLLSAVGVQGKGIEFEFNIEKKEGRDDLLTKLLER
jgi:hypothetical protein